MTTIEVHDRFGHWVGCGTVDNGTIEYTPFREKDILDRLYEVIGEQLHHGKKHGVYLGYHWELTE